MVRPPPGFPPATTEARRGCATTTPGPPSTGREGDAPLRSRLTGRRAAHCRRSRLPVSACPAARLALTDRGRSLAGGEAGHYSDRHRRAAIRHRGHGRVLHHRETVDVVPRFDVGGGVGPADGMRGGRTVSIDQSRGADWSPWTGLAVVRGDRWHWAGPWSSWRCSDATSASSCLLVVRARLSSWARRPTPFRRPHLAPVPLDLGLRERWGEWHLQLPRPPIWRMPWSATRWPGLRLDRLLSEGEGGAAAKASRLHPRTVRVSSLGGSGGVLHG